MMVVLLPSMQTHIGARWEYEPSRVGGGHPDYTPTAGFPADWNGSTLHIERDFGLHEIVAWYFEGYP